MSFDKGTISFRMGYIPAGLPADWLERFQKQQLPPMDTLASEPVVGWCGNRHMLDYPVTDANSTMGGHPSLTLVKAERVVSSSLLKAKCAEAEQAYMKQHNKTFVDRKTRGEIRDNIRNTLIQQSPPRLTGIPFVYDDRAKMVYIGATSEKQLDAFMLHFMKATDAQIVCIEPATAAAKLNAKTSQWRPMSFTANASEDDCENSPGMDFMTWLWFRVESGGGTTTLPELGNVAVMLEGPLLLEGKGNGAHEAALRKGVPTTSSEAKAALVGGKKLRRATLGLAIGDEGYSCKLDGDSFTLRGAKLPDAKERVDAESEKQRRILKLGMLRDGILGLYAKFVAEREDTANWAATIEEIHQWVEERAGRS